MQITLFKALKSIKIGDDQATAFVGQLEEHVETVVNNNIVRFEGNIARVEGRIAALEGKFEGVQATLEAIKSQNVFIGIMISLVGLAIVTAPIVTKLIH